MPHFWGKQQDQWDPPEGIVCPGARFPPIGCSLYSAGARLALHALRGFCGAEPALGTLWRPGAPRASFSWGRPVGTAIFR